MDSDRESTNEAAAQAEKRLDAEARVGNGVFGVGVPERLVIEAAQRAAKHPQGGISEEAGRELRQMIADNAGRAAFLESHPAVSEELSRLIEENERLSAALSTQPVQAQGVAAVAALRMAMRDMEAIGHRVAESGSLVGYFCNRLNENQAPAVDRGLSEAHGQVYQDRKVCVPPSAPVGWVLVPNTATHNMLKAANAGRKKGRSSSGDIYQAMIAAAPAAAAAADWQTMINGLTEEEARATASVAGLSPGALAASAPSQADPSYQQRVEPWLLACFGAEISGDKIERNHRHLEESLELVQACGCTRSEAHQLVDYVFDRPAGDPFQEAGGVLMTLAALCRAQGIDMHAAGEAELTRVWGKVEQIRAKQASKPKHSPLPQAPSQAGSCQASVEWATVEVNQGFPALMAALDRAARKGYMPDSMTAEWEAFEYRLPFSGEAAAALAGGTLTLEHAKQAMSAAIRKAGILPGDQAELLHWFAQFAGAASSTTVGERDHG